MEREQSIYSVPGMSCEHCRVAITSEVARVPGVGSVVVDLDRKLVTVAGSALSDAAVEAAIDDAGYDAVRQDAA